MNAPLLILGTANRHKARELVALLEGTGLDLATLADLSDPLEIDELGGSLAENARLKAARQARHLGQWVLGDDTGLLVDALGGAPGLHTARYAGPTATAEANRQRLLAELEGAPLDRRGARFVCHLALADPDGTIRAAGEGSCRGRIRLAPAGPRDFGYDCLFEIVEYHRTLAELGQTAKVYLTHRARAVRRLAGRIAALLGHVSDKPQAGSAARHGYVDRPTPGRVE